MKTNNLIYKANKQKNGMNVFVKIRLNDECNNGHEDFSITAMIYEAGKAVCDKNMISGGCCHDEILEVFPEFKIFVNLHLSDYSGAPMYAIENGYYHMTNLENDNSKEITMDYLRISEDEYNKIKDLDKLNFSYQLFNLGVVERWKGEAKKAIEILEDLTGQIFESKATKKQIKELTRDEIKTVKIRQKNGYYKPETIEQRKAQYKKDVANKIIEDLQQSRDKNIKKANDEYNVKIFVINSGLSIENFIYHNHINTGRFNWLSYKPQIKKEDLQILQSLPIPKNLPEGIKFEFDK